MMPKKPRYSPGYLRAIQRDAREWNVWQVQRRDQAIREAIEAEKAAVFAELEKNKRGE